MWLDDAFAGVMAAIALYSLGRLVAARVGRRPTHLDVDAAHVLMGTAMAGMLVPSLGTLSTGVWALVFAALAGWFVWRCYLFVNQHGVEGRDEDHVHHLSHYLTHLVMSGSMLYMYLAATPVATRSGGGTMMAGATGTTTEFVGLPLLFLVVLFASAIWELDGIERFAPIRPPRAPVAPTPTPALAPAGAGVNGTFAGQVAEPGEGGSSGRRAPWLAPRLEAACHIVMCVTMGYMLVLLL
jgi:hypothetical protein